MHSFACLDGADNDMDGDATWLTSPLSGGTALSMCVPYPAWQAVRRDLMPASSASLLPHPHVQDLYFVGTVASTGCEYCDPLLPLGVYLLQRRTNPGDSVGVWSFVRAVADDLGYPQITAIEWGSADGDEHLDQLYLATSGGGMWEAEVSW